MPTSNEQRKLNEQLKITQQLLADINDGYQNISRSTRPVLDMGNQMLKEAQSSFEFASKKENLTKKEAKSLGYAGARLQAIEESYKHITDNIASFGSLFASFQASLNKNFNSFISLILIILLSTRV